MELEDLTALQAAFVQEFIEDEDYRAAALRAGCDPLELDEQLRTMLFEPAVAHAIDQAKAQRKQRSAMSKDAILHEMSFLSHSSIAHYIINDNGQVELAPGAPHGAMRAVKSIKKKTRSRREKDGSVTTEHDVELTLWDKPAPLRLMGKQIGLFPDKMELTGRDGKPIETVTRVERVIVRVPDTGGSSC